MAAVAGPSRLAANANGKRTKRKHKVHAHQVAKLSEKARIDALERAAKDFVPPANLSKFADLPISDPTKRGLKKASFVEMTDIQQGAIPAALRGADVLGAGPTGSGKTLAFLVPLLEALYRRRWGAQDGLGALVISPTRELAVQIFDVLRVIGGYHAFSAGLVIGGKSLHDEATRLARMHILVATPGRLLQHLDQTAGFDSSGLQLLVLDEADRLLDLGFARTLAALLGHLPKTRQTLLFSATQTASVADLARLSLNSPVPIGLPAPSSATDAALAMPAGLAQHYAVVPLERKLSVLYSFIRTHLTSKTLVFLSSTKQVRHAFAAFSRLRPGVPLLHLTGRQKTTARLAAVDKFRRASAAVLLATDVAARGLDFPGVGWVVQVDAPGDVATYVHRAGRTARYASAGAALLLLCPGEEAGFTARLAAAGITAASIKIREKKTEDVTLKMQNLAFKESDVKYLAQRAFVSYMRSIYLQADKETFKLENYDPKAYAESLGLAGVPKIKFLKNAGKRGAAVEVAEPAWGSDEEASSDEAEADLADEEPAAASSQKPAVRTKHDRLFERKNQGVLSEHYLRMVDHADDGVADGSDADDFLTLKRVNHKLSDDESGSDADAEGLRTADAENVSKRKLKMGASRKAMRKVRDAPLHLRFDDDGTARDAYEIRTADDEADAAARAAGQAHAEEQRARVAQADVRDRAEAKARKQEKKRKRRERERDMRGDAQPMTATLGDAGDDGDDGYVSPEFDLPSADEDMASPPPPAKRHRVREAMPDDDGGLEDEEALALALLRRGQ